MTESMPYFWGAFAVLLSLVVCGFLILIMATWKAYREERAKVDLHDPRNHAEWPLLVEAMGHRRAAFERARDGGESDFSLSMREAAKWESTALAHLSVILDRIAAMDA